MQSKFLQLIKRISSWHNVLLLGVVTLLLAAVILPEADASLKEVSNGMGRLSSKFFYSPDFVYQTIVAYGEVGRELYIFSILTAGLIASISFTLFLCTLTYLLLNKIPFEHKEKLLFLPLAIFGFDMLENASMVFLLSQFPLEFPLFARFLALFALIKWLAIGLSIIMVCGLSGMKFYQIIKTIKLEQIELPKEKQETSNQLQKTSDQ